MLRPMFERFTDRARYALVLSQDEARLLGHSFIGTEHILLGLIHEGRGAAAKALESTGSFLEPTRDTVAEIIGPSADRGVSGAPFTPRSKKVLELSLQECLSLGHTDIGTEHLLLGLLREGEGVGAQVLTRLGVDAEELRRRVFALLGEEPRSAPRREEPFMDRPASASALSSRWAAVSPQPRLPSQTCILCGRDLWETQLYVSGEIARVCDECVSAAYELIRNARTADEGPELVMPPRVFGDVPDTEAAGQIAMAFRQAFKGTDTADQNLHLEDAESLRPYRDEAASRSMVRVLGCGVGGIRFLTSDSAQVRFTLELTGGGSFPFVGLAVRQEGRWKVSRETQADLLRRGGLQMPDV
jgi:Clp amino terminal domain, pathogenicity island component